MHHLTTSNSIVVDIVVTDLVRNNFVSMISNKRWHLWRILYLFSSMKDTRENEKYKIEKNSKTLEISLKISHDFKMTVVNAKLVDLLVKDSVRVRRRERQRERGERKVGQRYSRVYRVYNLKQR